MSNEDFAKKFLREINTLYITIPICNRKNDTNSILSRISPRKIGSSDRKFNVHLFMSTVNQYATFLM